MSTSLVGPLPAHPVPSHQLVPLAGVAVPAGFPSPADDWTEDRVDLNQHFVPNPEATFFFRVKGDSMWGSDPDRSIPDGATLIVDRSKEAHHGDVVVAVVDGGFTVKRLYRRGSRVALIAENPRYRPIELHDGQELLVWGVVTAWISGVR